MIDFYKNHQLVKEVLRVWKEHGFGPICAHRINLLASQYKDPTFEFKLHVRWVWPFKASHQVIEVSTGDNESSLLAAEYRLRMNLKRLGLEIVDPYKTVAKQGVTSIWSSVTMTTGDKWTSLDYPKK